MLSPEHSKSVRAAIELMYVWDNCPEGCPDRLIECFRTHVEGHPSGDPVVGATELIMGLVTLNGSLLALRKLETGARPWQTLICLADEYARD